jgi:hypothetical protein
MFQFRVLYLPEKSKRQFYMETLICILCPSRLGDFKLYLINQTLQNALEYIN